MKPGIAYASQLAEWYGIQPIQEGEEENTFRHRVSGALRDEGRVIEAHEAHCNMRYDDPEQGEMGPMGGILGAAAMALHGRDYGSTGSSLVGDEIASGVVARKPPDDPMMALLLMAMVSKQRS